MLKKVLWTVPVLAIGIAIGGLTLPNVFAATSNQSNNNTGEYSQAGQMMQSAWSSPQGRQMIQSCESFMNQYSQAH